MRSFQPSAFRPRSFAAKLFLILSLFALPAVTPSTDTGPINLGPKKVQAGIPIMDISQVFGHVSEFGQNIAQLVQFGRKVRMMGQNLQALGSLVNNVTGWDGMQNFFKPVNQWMDENFDPVLSQVAFGANALQAMGEFGQRFFSYSEDDKSHNEQRRDARKFLKEMGKDFWQEPAKFHQRMESFNAKVEKAQDCVEAAKGNQSMQHCITHLQTLGISQMSYTQEMLARQLAYMATEGVNSREAIAHRRRAMRSIMISSQAQQNYVNGPDGWPDLKRLN